MNHLKYENLGSVLPIKANIKLKKQSQPCYFETRNLPVHVKTLALKELYEMEKGNIIKKVEGGSEWASPIVVVRKSDGSVRICGDYKVGVNERICCDSYNLPNIEVAFMKMANKNKFAKLDLSSAYWQIELDEMSKDITTINTPIGLYKFNRLPYGIKSAPAILKK